MRSHRNPGPVSVPVTPASTSHPAPYPKPLPPRDWGSASFPPRISFLCNSAMGYAPSWSLGSWMALLLGPSWSDCHYLFSLTFPFSLLSWLHSVWTLPEASGWVLPHIHSKPSSQPYLRVVLTSVFLQIPHLHPCQRVHEDVLIPRLTTVQILHPLV